jgi:hypothetical protein
VELRPADQHADLHRRRASPGRCRLPKRRSSRRCSPTRRRSRRPSARSTTRSSTRTARANSCRRSGVRSKRCEQYAATARLRYDNGYTSYIEVLDAERSLFNVQLQYTQTQQAEFQAMINLYLAMGGGWVNEADQLARTAPMPQRSRRNDERGRFRAVTESPARPARAARIACPGTDTGRRCPALQRQDVSSEERSMSKKSKSAKKARREGQSAAAEQPAAAAAAAAGEAAEQPPREEARPTRPTSRNSRSSRLNSRICRAG